MNTHTSNMTCTSTSNMTCTSAVQVNDVVDKLLQRFAEVYVCANVAEEANQQVKDALSDAALVESIVLRGNQQHFRTLLARYKTKVHHIALSVLGPSQQAQAEDVAQEVFIKLYQRLESFRGDCLFSTWIYRLAINATIDYQRKNRKFESVDIVDVIIPGSSAGAASILVEGETSARVKVAVNSLQQTQRMMVYLFYWLGFKIREIAEVMDCPEGTVKVYLRRAKKHLAEQLGDRLDE